MIIITWLIACGESDEDLYTGPSGSGNDIFCNEFVDADESQSREDAGLVGSGRLNVQLVVDKVNPHDGNIVGNATYILQNPLVGGGEQIGSSSPLGDFSKTLGAGTWELEVKGGENCSNFVEIEIVAGTELDLCVPLYCDE